jgi:hypothetical protein
MELDTQGLETAHRAYVRRRSQMAQIDTTESVRDRLALIAAIRAYVLTTQPIAPPAAPLSAASPPPVRSAAVHERRTTVLVPLDTFVFDEG